MAWNLICILNDSHVLDNIDPEYQDMSRKLGEQSWEICKNYQNTKKQKDYDRAMR